MAKGKRSSGVLFMAALYHGIASAALAMTGRDE